MRFVLAVLVSLLWMNPPICFAEEASPKTAEVSIPKPKVRTPEEKKKIDQVRERMKLKREELNGSSWDVTVASTSDKKIKPFKDTLVFQDGQISIKSLEKRGFVTTNYSISVSPDPATESAVWETMKTGKEGIVFIRGEWVKENMSGSFIEQLDGGKKVHEFYFNSDARVAIAKSSKKEDPAKGEGATLEANPSIQVPVDVAPSQGSALVSKERVPEIAAFKPGTTEESVS